MENSNIVDATKRKNTRTKFSAKSAGTKTRAASKEAGIYKFGAGRRSKLEMAVIESRKLSDSTKSKILKLIAVGSSRSNS